MLEHRRGSPTPLILSGCDLPSPGAQRSPDDKRSSGFAQAGAACRRGASSR